MRAGDLGSNGSERSPKMTANCALAMTHSRGPIFHAFSERFKTR
ncbi:hypothetical protein ABIE45_006184 [Methylobacterium sp. OAE515]